MCEDSKNCPVFATVGDVWWTYSIRPYNWIRVTLRNTNAIFRLNTCGPSKNCPVFIPFGAAWWGVFNTPLQSGTCAPSKYRCNFPTEYVRPFKKLSRFRPLWGRLWGVFNTPLRMGTCDSSKYRCNFPTGYVRCYEIPMQFPNRVRMALQKTVSFSSPSSPRCGAYSIRPYDRVRVTLRNTDAISQLDACSSSKNSPVSVPFGAAGWGVCDTPLQLDTCCPSKNHPVFVPFGDVCGAYSIRPYDRVRAILRNTDAIFRPGMCGPSKNCPIFVPFGAGGGGF